MKKFLLPGMIALGLPLVAALSAAPSAFAAAPSGQTLTMVATAYGPSATDNYPYGATDYFGQPLVAGDVAVDPSVIPLGTRLYISGYSSPYLPAGGFYAVARDTGGAITGDRVDIFINLPDGQVSTFGIQKVTVTILGPDGSTGSSQTVQSGAVSTTTVQQTAATTPVAPVHWQVAGPRDWTYHLWHTNRWQALARLSWH